MWGEHTYQQVLAHLFVQVRVADNEDVSCYALARRWLENDPDGCANPVYLSRVKAQAAVPGMGPYPGGLGIPGEHPSVPQFWELDPIALPPRLPESGEEAAPPPRIKPLKEEKKKDKSLAVEVPIEVRCSRWFHPSWPQGPWFGF